MLNKLKINNFALIKSLEVDFLSGFNVLLGETGAGKSIIFDAINFVLGDKADKTMIRTGEETLKVSALFTNVNDSVKKILENFDIDSSDEVLITRTYSISGKGDVKVNGEIITVSMLKQLGEVLVDSYLQNEGISLLKQKNHLQILDSYKSEDIKDVVDELNIILEKIKSLTNEINELGGNESNRERQIDLLKYQINEIQSANLIEGEDEQVNEKLVKLSNSEKILENLKNAESFLFDENGCLSLLRHSISNLKVIEKYDDNISSIVEKFEESLLNLDEQSSQIYNIFDEYNFDENNLNNLMLRKELLDSLKHKYGGSISEVQNYCSQALQELDKLENAEEILALKHKEKNEMLSHAQTKFDILSKIRKQHALELEKNIEEGLKELGIEKAKFKVNFIKIANSIFDVNQYSINCLEDVEFLFSANMGEELKPLSKIISGGEMNRFMLIFKNILAQNNGSQTLIFDEVDSGISGQIAVSVANKIAKLSKKYQILCITHLPQVAAMGDNFYFVFKSQIDGRTQTFIKQLSEDEIIKEISILTYGSVDSKKLELTSELIKNNYIYKSSLE